MICISTAKRLLTHVVAIGDGLDYQSLSSTFNWDVWEFFALHVTESLLDHRPVRWLLLKILCLELYVIRVDFHDIVGNLNVACRFRPNGANVFVAVQSTYGEADGRFDVVWS